MLTAENLTQTIQINLSHKQKTFCRHFFFDFSKSILNFKHLPNKDDPRT